MVDDELCMLGRETWIHERGPAEFAVVMFPFLTPGFVPRPQQRCALEIFVLALQPPVFDTHHAADYAWDSSAFRRRVTMNSMGWQGAEAWIFLSIGDSAEPGDLAELDLVISRTDSNNHSVPTVEEFEQAMSQLLGASLVTIEDTRFGLTNIAARSSAACDNYPLSR